MERRDFLKTGAAGLVGSFAVDASAESERSLEEAGAPQRDNRPAAYLRSVRGDRFLPKPPLPARSYAISPMPLAERVNRKVVPQRGFCSIAPGDVVSESLLSGNGAMTVELMGDPYTEQILFKHEELLMPWQQPLEAPQVAEIFPQVRQLVLAGKDREAMELALQHMNESPIQQDTQPHLTVPAFLMRLDLPKTASVSGYLRTVDFETGEATVRWSEEHGEWIRETFVSRPDNVVVQRLTAPAGRTLTMRLSLQPSSDWSMVSSMDWGSHAGIGNTAPDWAAFAPSSRPKAPAPKGIEANRVTQDLKPQRLIYTCVLDPSVNNSGYAGVVRVLPSGGSARVEGKSLVVENASALMLLTRIEHFPNLTDDHAEALQQELEQLTADYPALLERHRKVQSEALNRVTLDLGSAPQVGLAAEELLTDQRSRPDYSPALLEKVFEMGRYWFLINSGKYPSIAAEVNSTIDLQTAGAVQGDQREGMEAYFNWMESLAADHRTNAKNIFGLRGAAYPLFPDKGVGANFYYTATSGIGIWPYWISAGGWRARQFWDHYLVTGDREFLRNRVVPAYKDLALFYEDFLTGTDANGNYIFAPSISPENIPRNSDPSGPALVNATMDIAVCREVLSNLIQASQTLGADTDRIPQWKAMLAKMPPYLTELDGTLKEWAWPTLEEHYNHRHISHLYGAWPGDEIDPDRTPQLALAAQIANRRRTFDVLATAVSGETLAAYTRCHRALAGARLKDNVMVDIQLRQLMEQGYISNALRCSREPYAIPVPDAHGGIPAIVMEMLLYSRPGVIEVLPALPETLVRGSIRGMLSRSFARIDRLAWDMEARTVYLTITSSRPQNVTLIARHGVQTITAPAGILVAPLEAGSADIDLHLPEGRPVELRLKLGQHHPLDWVTAAMQV
jgi:alpha-L-fucosidase 2